MIAYTKDGHWIYIDQVTQGAEEALVAHFSARHPRSYFIDTEASWDGWYRKYNKSKQRVALPFLQELEICCKKNDIPLEIKDLRGPPKYPAPQKDHITDEFIDDITLDDHQVRALKVACDWEIGLYDITTGGGKTEIMCGLVKMFRCPSLIITEQIVVLEQIVQRLKLRNVVHNDDIGVFCYGNRPDGNLVMVGSIQSLNSPPKPPKTPKIMTTKQTLREGKRLANKGELYKKDGEKVNALPDALAQALEENPSAVSKLPDKYMDMLKNYVSVLNWERVLAAHKVRSKNAKNLQKMAKGCDLLMVDECDKAASSLYRGLFQYHFKGRRRYGFSGTPFDVSKPHAALLLKERLGSIIESAGRGELTEIGRIIPARYYMIAVGEDGDKFDSTAFDIAEREILIENQDFHELVSKIVARFQSDSTMILVDTSAIVELGTALELAIPNSKFIYNKTTKKRRRDCIADFEQKRLDCLIGGKILKRGLDLKGGMHNLILCGGGPLVSNLDQMVGRGVRVNDRGYVRIFDFLFLNNKYLYKHSRARLKAIIEMGYESKVVVAGQEIDGERFVRSKFRIPKRK